MDRTLLTAQEAADRLGIARASLYDWLAASNAGTFRVRGQLFTIDYYQGGPRGQGSIRIRADEVDRIFEAMRVRPTPQPQRRPPQATLHFPGITVPLGRPGQRLG
ncbi:MAG: helix-turn-helix domain-containing protein [Planctomycetales bacterium]|nr:helix-turn-helix domain-containing protein [Planctomycetales bacterium]